MFLFAGNEVVVPPPVVCVYSSVLPTPAFKNVDLGVTVIGVTAKLFPDLPSTLALKGASKDSCIESPAGGTVVSAVLSGNLIVLLLA